MFPSLRKKDKKEKDGFLLRIGAAVLEKHISLFNGDRNPIRSYSTEEIVKATSNFRWPIHEDGFHVLYKGIHEGREISMKKSKIQENGDEFIEGIATEVAIASRMSNHKNALKLLGCCLETDFPILVYEFPGKGNLGSYIYGDIRQLPWERKLRIAVEIANAVAYLHHGLSKMIIHRNIKPSNMYLDQNYSAKLFGFNYAVPIPEGETHVFACVIGTFGFASPETICQGRYTEKVDVYSFGVLLGIFLTGKRIKDVLDLKLSNESHTSENLGFPSSLLEEYCELYPEEENIREQVKECAELVKRCVKKDPDDRPDMIEAAKTLRLIKSKQY